MVCPFTDGSRAWLSLQGETNNWRILLPNQELAVVCSLFAWFLTSRFGFPGEAFIALDLLLLLRLPVDLSLELVCLIIWEWFDWDRNACSRSGPLEIDVSAGEFLIGLVAPEPGLSETNSNSGSCFLVWNGIALLDGDFRCCSWTETRAAKERDLLKLFSVGTSKEVLFCRLHLLPPSWLCLSSWCKRG